MPSITITYQRWTPEPEDLDLGEPSETGWIDDEGIPMDPEDDEDPTAVESAVEFLKRRGAVHPSSNPPTGIQLWFSDEPELDPTSGIQEVRSFHLQGFSVEEELQIFHHIHHGGRQHAG